MAKIKLSFFQGLKDIALAEIAAYPKLTVEDVSSSALLLKFTEDWLEIKSLKSVNRAYVVSRDPKFNPSYISRHKSILGSLIETVFDNSSDKFKTFKIICAGADSLEVFDLIRYVSQTYKISEDKENPDMKIHIIKTDNQWEVGVQITSKTLAIRDYKIRSIKGAMNPTIAYAMNSLCNLDKSESYLNVFSGSATLLIEAAKSYENLQRLIGFDNNKKHISLGIQNIKKSGLIKKIELKEADIYDEPNLGIFDVITSNLPFGMRVSKGEDLELLYRQFIKYCENSLKKNGLLAVYTSEYEILGQIIGKNDSKFKILKTLQLKFKTSAKSYIKPKILVCRLK